MLKKGHEALRRAPGASKKKNGKFLKTPKFYTQCLLGSQTSRNFFFIPKLILR